jgi:hypothetical protein
MKNHFKFIAVKEDLSWVEKAAATHVSRKRAKLGIVLLEEQVPKAFHKYDVGKRFGSFHELIEFREIRTDGIPSWFKPKEEPGHIGLIDAAGFRVYLRLTVDVEKRSQPSIFDQMIMEFAEPEPEQTTLF